MTPDMIRQLPARYALMVRGGMSPVIARLPMAWTGATYKWARINGQATAVLTTSAEAGTLVEDAPSARDPWPSHYTEPDVPPPADTWNDPGRYPWQ